MTTQNIEVEVRGRLTEEKYNELTQFFHKEGKHIESKHRILVDYSTFLTGEGVKERTRDIRLRITNGKPEIITKLGKWGGQESRKEISIFTEEGSFDALVENYAVLGYTKGVLCIRNTEVFQYKDIEFALVEVPGHSLYYEAEVLVPNQQAAETAHEKLETVCRELDLSMFSSEEFYSYIEELNREANEVFDFDKEGPGYFKKRFGV